VVLNLLVLLVITMEPSYYDSLFQSRTSVKKKFGVSTKTLQTWSTTGKIETVRFLGGKRLYSMPALNSLLSAEQTKERASICYARVSSPKQAGDLERQVSALRETRPGHEILKDVGSGLNWKRPGFLALLERIYSGEVATVVVFDKDRLCCFGFELIEWISKKHSRVIVHNQKTEIEDTGELAEDLLAIVNFFVARSNGRRAGRNGKARKM
jgi:putative resolvase